MCCRKYRWQKETEKLEMKKQFVLQEQLNNKGLTLVELLISIMILAVVSTAVFAFMTTGAQIFNRSNLEVEMQNEAQILKNYMNDLICDTTKKVEFVKNTDVGATTYGADSCLTIYGEDYVAYMGWMKESKEVRFLKKGEDSYTVDEDGTYHVTLADNETSAANWPLMATYVTKFNCNTDELKKEHRIFSAELGLELKQLSYETTHTIALRNDVFYEGKSDVTYEEAMGSFRAQITRITLAPGSVDKAIDRVNGTSVEFTPTVLAIGDIDTSVTYEVEGNTSSNTRMEGNILRIAKDENSPVLTVICKSVVDEEISTTAVVNIASVSAVVIEAKEPPAYQNLYYFPNSFIEFEAKVEGNFATTEGRNVTWELVGDKGSAYIVQEGTTGTTCKIHTGSEKNKNFKVKATSLVDPKVSAEYEVYVANIEVDEFYIAAENGEYAVRRGSSLQLEVLENGNRVSNAVTWSIKNNPVGSKLKIDAATGKITAGIDIEHNKSYQFTVEAAVVDKDNTVKTVTCAVRIDPVQLVFEPEYVIMAAKAGGNPYRVKVTVKGIDARDGELVVQQKPYVRKLEHWVVSQEKSNAVLGLNMSLAQDAQLKNDYHDYTELKVSLKGHSNVSALLPVWIYRYNIGTDKYAPVPGDETNLVPDENKDGIPDTTESVTIGNTVYGYAKVNVNGTVYHYYVNTSQTSEWYVQISNDANKYKYDTSTKTYVALSN